MEFNKDILNYCIKGTSDDNNRYLMSTLKNTLLELDISTTVSFDSFTYYQVVKHSDGFRMDMKDRSSSPCLSIENYLFTLLGYPVELNWFDNLKKGDTVKIGWCAPRSDDYGLGFDCSLVTSYRDQIVTIKDIVPFSLCRNTKWSNNDTRVYQIKEMNHFIPSAVMVPTFCIGKMVKQLQIQSFSVLDTLINEL